MPVKAAESGYSAKGTPAIDGIKDDIYDNSMQISIGRSETVTAKVWTLWDETRLYVFAEVYDKQVVDTPDDIFQPWQSDSIEIYINRNGALTPGYEDDDQQVRVDCNGNISGMNKTGWGKEMIAKDISEISGAAVKTDTGYTTECSIPLRTAKGAPDSKIGFDVMVNNADFPNMRSSFFSWGGGGNSGPNGWNELIFMETVPDNLKSAASNEIMIKKGDNVAFNKTAYLSVSPGWENYGVCAIDGDLTTYAQGNENSLYSLTVDLHYVILCDRLTIKQNDSNYATGGKLEYSADNFLWNDLTEIQCSNPLVSEITFTPTDMRYVRFTPNGVVGGGFAFGYAISEFEVYAEKDQVIVLSERLDDKGVMNAWGVIDGEVSITEKVKANTKTYPNTLIGIINVLAVIFSVIFTGTLVLMVLYFIKKFKQPKT